MSEFKKIVVATDFSKGAEYALIRASQLNMKKLTILHVFPTHWIDDAVQWFVTSKNSEYLEFKQAALKVFNKKLKPLIDNIKTKFIVKKGREAETITNYAKSQKADLLAIGAHGNYHFHEYFIGTTAEAIVKHAPCPVWVVKRKPNFTYKKILVPIDFSLASRKALEFACKKFPDCSIQVLHVEDLWYDKSVYHSYMKNRREGILRKQMTKLVRAEIDDFIKNSDTNGSKLTYIIRGGYPAKVIASEVKTKRCDLVVMGTRGQTQLQYVLIGSVAERILNEVSTDVIAVPPADDR